MSDRSRDTALLDQSGALSQTQESGHKGRSSESESGYASDDEGEHSNTNFAELMPLSKKLGHVEIFGSLKNEVDGIHAWLKGLVNDSTDNVVSVQKSTLCHHKRAVETMRRRLRDAAPMAFKTSQYMDASVKKTIITKVDKVIAKMLKSEGVGSIAMKKLLAQTDFESQLLQDIETEVLEGDEFPHGEHRLLIPEINEAVDYHLGGALLKQAQKQTEADLLEKFHADKKDLLEKFNAKRRKAVQGVEDELRSAGLMLKWS